MVIIYLISFILLTWIYGGYVLSLTLFFKKRKSSSKTIAWTPSIEIIVPVFCEEDLISGKVKNLLSLDYPFRKLGYTFVDGGSDDNTLKILKKIAFENKRIKIIKTGFRNKIKQINQALSRCTAEIVVISDVDTVLNVRTIQKLVKEFNNRPEVMVVGAQTMPKQTSLIDLIYWEKQNEVRLLESKTISSSIVIANCFAFRRTLLDQFPNDVVADDIYIAFLAQSQGLRVVYTEDLLALELRSPQSVKSFLQHKFRKSHAYITEIFRFFPTIFRGNWQWKLIYLTKLLQIIATPVLAVIYVSLTIYFLNNPFLPSVTVSLLIAFTVMASFSLKKQTTGRLFPSQILPTIACFILVNLILFYSLLVYPLYKQVASFKKIS